MIEVKLPKCGVIVTEAEFPSLLAHDKDIWERAIERGKAIMRARAARRGRPREAHRKTPRSLDSALATGATCARGWPDSRSDTVSLRYKIPACLEWPVAKPFRDRDGRLAGALTSAGGKYGEEASNMLSIVLNAFCWFAAGMLLAGATTTLVGALRYRRKPRGGA